MPKSNTILGWALFCTVCCGLGYIVGGKTVEPRRDPLDPIVVSETLLTKELFKQGYLARVRCIVFNDDLMPLCEATLQHKTGGPESAPVKYRGTHSPITWESY